MATAPSGPTAPSGTAQSLHGTDTSSDVEAEDSRHAARGSMFAGNAGNNKLPAMKLRTFGGRRSEYTEWKREVEATKLLYGISDDKLAPLVCLALDSGLGKPRDLLSHLDIVEDICTATGFIEIFKTLDIEYVREAYIKADDAQTKYEKCSRKPYENMHDYIKDLKKAKRHLEMEDPGSTISDVSFARRLLRRSGLTRMEQRQVLAACGARWDVVAITDALKLMYGDAHLEDKRRSTAMHHRWVPAASKGKGKGKDKDKDKDAKNSGTYHADEADDDSEEDANGTEGAEDSDEEDDEDESDDEEGDEDGGPDDPEELMETYFQGLKAKKKLKDLGYSRKPASTGGKRDRKKNSTCKDCKGKGHWSGDAECPKVKDGTVAPFVPKPPTGKPKVSFAGMATWDDRARGSRDTRPTAQVLTPAAEVAAEDPPPRMDLSIYTEDQLRLYLARKKLSTSGGKEMLKRRIRDYMSQRSARREEEASTWTWTTIDGASATDGEPECQHRRVREDATPTNSWRVCCDCGKRMSATSLNSGVTNYFIGCVACEPAKSLWQKPDANRDYNTTANHEHDYLAEHDADHYYNTTANHENDHSAEHGAHHVLSHAVIHVDTCEKAIPDSGCRRSVAGKEWHSHMRSALAEHGLTPVYRPTNERFKFGDGRVEVARVAWTYPVGLYGAHGTIDIAEVSSACPPLLSVEAMEELGIVLNFLNKTVSIENAKVYDQPMERTSSGHPAIPLTKYTEGATFPDEFLIYYTDPVYSVENEDTKFMKRGARKRLARIANSLAEVFGASNNDRKRRILEILTWTQRVTLIAREYGWEGREPLSIETGYDITTAEG